MADGKFHEAELRDVADELERLPHVRAYLSCPAVNLAPFPRLAAKTAATMIPVVSQLRDPIALGLVVGPNRSDGTTIGLREVQNAGNYC